MSPRDDTSPPPPPAPPAHLRLTVAQRIGIPAMALVPALALAGVFGERRSTLHRDAGSLLVAVRAPARFRYRQRMTLDVGVANRGRAPLHDVRVRVDSAYLDRFSGVATAPPVAPDGSIPLGDVAPASSARVAITLDGDRAGRAGGIALVTDAGGDTVRVPLSSFVFP